LSELRLSIEDQLLSLETYLGRPIPGALRDAYLDGRAQALRLLPVATGREHEPSRGGSAPEQFSDAEARLRSVLGHAVQNVEAAASSLEGHVWPPGLLVIEDHGCAIYRAVDLEDAELRVIEYEYLDPVDDPQQAAGARRLAYAEPAVPRAVQHRFVVLAHSLAGWLQRER
jgi:hypothetical protein